MKNLLAVRILATAEISVKLLTCQNKRHKTTLRPILESKGFPKVLTRAASPQFRGRLWSAACWNCWFGISQPWPCSGLNGTGSTSLLINADAHSKLHLEHAAFPWNGKLSDFPSTSLVRCDFHHQWLQSAIHNSWGQEREPETCPYVSQGKESVGIFQASRNRRRAVENFWPSTLLMGICTYAQGALPLQTIIKSYWIKMTFTSEHSGTLSTPEASQTMPSELSSASWTIHPGRISYQINIREMLITGTWLLRCFDGKSVLWKCQQGRKQKLLLPLNLEVPYHWQTAALCQRLLSPI